MQTLNVVFFYQYFGTPKGSWSTRVYENAKRWVDRGHNVTVVTAPYEKSDIKARGFISRQNIEGINLIVIDSADSNKNSFVVRVIKALIFSLCSLWYALTLKYDICIASSGPITIGLPMIVAKRIRRKKTIFEVRDLWPAGAIELGLIRSGLLRSLASWFERKCYNNADVIVTASIGQKRHITDREPNKRVEVIPNASDLTLFGTPAEGQLPEWTHGKVLLTHIGSLGLIHNIQYWIDVAKHLLSLDIERKLELIFIGDGIDRIQLEKEKEAKKIDNIHFLGLKPKNELPIWVQKSTATLFATLDNPVQSTCSPNKIFDSFAAGKPIIQTTNGWIKDLVDEFGCGLTVELSSPYEAACQILDFVNDERRVTKSGKAAQDLAINMFNREKLAYTYLGYLQELKNA